MADPPFPSVLAAPAPRRTKRGEGDSLAGDLALALDPVRFAVAAGMAPDPWQAQVLRSTAPRILLNACRQSGKSTTTALSGCWRKVPATASETYGAADADGTGLRIYHDGLTSPFIVGGHVLVRSEDQDWEWTDDTTTVHAASLPAGASANLEIETSDTLGGGSTRLFLLRNELGQLQAWIGTSTGTTEHTIADPGDRYWRLRHSASLDQLYCETAAAAGGPRTIRAQRADLAGNQHHDTVVRLGANTEPVIFKDFNGGGRACCPTEPCGRQRSRVQLIG